MHVIIAGAGVAGLSTAISLRRCGHQVTIYERSALNHELGAAINAPPNVSRFLIALGVDVVKAQFVPSESMYVLSHTQRDKVLFHSDFRHNIDTYGAHLYYAHRVDLHESLKRMATEADGPGIPVVINTRSEVVAFDPETPSMTLKNGTVIKGDLVIGADGIHSVSVVTILGCPNPPRPALHSNCCYRFLIPRDEVENDPETSFFTTSLVDWDTPAEKAEVLEALAGYDPGLLAVVSKCTEFKRWPLLYRPPIPIWHKGKMAIVGDAAHPMLPHQGQGGAQGLEDGLALGIVMVGASEATIEDRLAIYQKIRHHRASAIQVLSNYGFDQKPPEEVMDYLEGQTLPTNAEETIKFNYRVDTVQRAIDNMKAYDPDFELPADLFPFSEQIILYS
ncbi:FAD binding domain-containing protein [Diaporthe helianthi]|uniref:FAD binding domain-containing protein n=1 Tax=Diaporthe helianthi TaxID=158607 RepID=A0A2P5HVR7_DIAHE|nr:FAD binding domain-containing protein [Diaporthe helianthi]